MKPTSPQPALESAFVQKKQLREVTLRMEDLRTVISTSATEMRQVRAAMEEQRNALERLREAMATAKDEHAALEIRRDELKAELDRAPESDDVAP